MKKKKVSMQDIANAVSMSKYAVSRALSGKSGVTPETRQFIIDAAKQLGYVHPKKTDSGIIGPHDDINRDRHTIAVIMIDERFQSRENPYWGGILDGLQAYAAEKNLGMIVISEAAALKFGSVINPDSLLGMIVIGHLPTDVLFAIKQTNVHIVMVDYEHQMLPCDTVFMSNFDCMRKLVQYLVGLGHQSFMFMGSVAASRSAYDRWWGFLSTLEDCGIKHQQPVELLNAYNFSRLETENFVGRWIKQQKKLQALPTAFVCNNDVLASDLIAILKDNDIGVPEDCSVTGFDDCFYGKNKITTIRSELETMGRRAVDTLIWRMQHPGVPHEKILISGELVIKETTVAPGQFSK